MSRLLHLKTLTSPLRRHFSNAVVAAATTPSPTVFTSNLLRLLSDELTYYTTHLPPPPPELFTPFWIDDRPGHQFLRLLSHHAAGREEIKLDATLVDGAVPYDPRPGFADEVRCHISLVVEITKLRTESHEHDHDHVLAFVCSAWSDALEVKKVFPIRKQGAALRPYMGRDFKRLDKKMKDAVYGYLAERGVDDELAEFLHEYMENKEKSEVLGWLGEVDAYVRK